MLSLCDPAIDNPNVIPTSLNSCYSVCRFPLSLYAPTIDEPIMTLLFP